MLHQSEQVLRPVARYRESRRTARHLVNRHLIEAFEEEHLQLREYLVEPSRYLREGLQHAQQVIGRHLVVQSLHQCVTVVLEEVDGARMDLVEVVPQRDHVMGAHLVKCLGEESEFVKVVKVSRTFLLRGEVVHDIYIGLG